VSGASRQAQPQETAGGEMMNLLHKFESVINVALLCLMSVVVLLTTVDLGWMIVKEMTTSPILMLNVGQILDLFAAVLVVLIGVELLDTIKVYIIDRTIRVELILSVGLVAITRKVIILDSAHMEGLTLIGIASVILSLAASYMLVKRTHTNTKK
jgi:uncharacterized membrane protein (DUF373 family)